MQVGYQTNMTKVSFITHQENGNSRKEVINLSFCIYEIPLVVDNEMTLDQN